ncbi:MAG: Pr6Pr family membrane protein [Firmicutes bacterium]|nr:Pr6Pr family membrane protein [Bacillota bacterium]
MNVSRKNDILSNIILILVLISSVWGILWSLFLYGFSDLRYFTNLSNLIVFVTVFLVFINKHDQKWFKYLSTIALINITMTGLIYHLLLGTPPISFQSHLTHTFTPILYVVFYYVSLEETIKPKQFWVSLLFPLAYFTFFLATGPITEFYPYWFMNVAEYGFGTVMKLVGLFMLPAIALLSWIMIYIKYIFLTKKQG